MTPTPRRSEIAALREEIFQTRSVRIEFASLWRIWCRVAPRLVGNPDQAAALHAALLELSQDAVIELPKGAWDNSTLPAQPQFVAVPTARSADRGRAWRVFPWRVELGWVASLPTLSNVLFADLVTINDWLSRIESQELPVVPVRYRSAEIFAREKRLDELERTTLFGPGRLSLSMLGCVRIAPPVPAAVVGSGADALIVENSDTYWVTVDALRNARGHAIGAVGWGSGKTFPAQVSSLAVDIAGQGPLRGTAWYWGDFDPPGTSTAVLAAQVTTEVRVRPATGLWAAMAGLTVQEAGKINWSGAVGRDWLGSDLWDRMEYVRSARGRIAQELVPIDAVVKWAAGLGAGER
jgi:hypothetical protein